MKKILPFIIALTCNLDNGNVNAQCSGADIRCSLNWDYLMFFPSAGISSYTNLSHSQTQRFAFGTQTVTISHNYASGFATGTSTSHTNETGSFGVGADVAFSGNGLITVTFQTGVQNVQFSVHDIDRLQRVTVASPGKTVTMTRLTTAVLTVAGSGTATANAVSSNTLVATTSRDGSVNVTINGATPVTSFTIAITQSSGSSNDFYLSDISACSGGSFTNNYFEVAKPYTNQGAYLLASKDNQVYFADALTGKAKYLFTASGTNPINSLAYDPVKHYVYYAQDNVPSSNPNNKTLYRYHYDMDTVGVLMSDVTSLVPTFDVGVETGGAAFYDGSLYFGIDISSASSVYKCIIWKIDFDAAANPIAASQVFGIAAGGHDWGDFAVAKGTLFNFDGQTGSGENYHHQNLYTKEVIVYTPSNANKGKQSGVDWNSNIYSVGDETSSSPFRGEIIPYNENGTLNNPLAEMIHYNGVYITGQWRDAAEAFKPRVDFGDAPSSYDPISSDPAVHEITPLLRLGDNSNDEWVTRGQTAPANSDNFDDGMVIGSLVNPSAGSFFTQIKYLNNTGALATICVWVDFNNNGVFDPGEGRMQTNLPSSASTQVAFFNWTGVSTSLTDGQYTYVRFRITSAANGMTVNNPTGFFDDGEVEDYRLAVTNFPLETNLISFTATKSVSGEGSVRWEVASEKAGTVYTVQRSGDSRNWKDLTVQQAEAVTSTNVYNFADPMPIKTTVYYRLKVATSGSTFYSEIRRLNYGKGMSVTVSPNPASNIALITLKDSRSGSGKVSFFDAAGRRVLSQQIDVAVGSNQYSINISGLQNGLYWMHLENATEVFIQRLLIEK